MTGEERDEKDRRKREKGLEETEREIERAGVRLCGDTSLMQF